MLYLDVSVCSSPVQQSVLFDLVANHQLMTHNFTNFWSNIFELINGPCLRRAYIYIYIYIYILLAYTVKYSVSSVGRLGSVSSLVPSSTAITLSTAMLGAH